MKTFWTLVILCALSLPMVSCNFGAKPAVSEAGQERGPVKPESVVVKLAIAERRQISTGMTLTGTLHARQDSNLSTLVSGKIEKIFVDIGMSVKKNQELVHIEREDFDNEVKEAKAALSLAQANLKNSELEYSRIKNLWEKNSVPKKLYDDSSTRLEVSAAQVQSAEAALSMAAKRQRDSILRAPYDGVITARYMDEGESVTSQPVTDVLQIMDISVLDLEIGVPENLSGTVTLDQEVKINVTGIEEPITGRVSAISDKVDVTNRTFKVKIEVPNPERRIKAGQFATASLSIERGRSPVVIPPDALQLIDGRKRVFVLDTDIVHERRVETGIASEEFVEVLSGLEEGERVVVGRLETLADSMKVTVEGAWF